MPGALLLCGIAGLKVVGEAIVCAGVLHDSVIALHVCSSVYAGSPQVMPKRGCVRACSAALSSRPLFPASAHCAAIELPFAACCLSRAGPWLPRQPERCWRVHLLQAAPRVPDACQGRPGGNQRHCHEVRAKTSSFVICFCMFLLGCMLGHAGTGQGVVSC
jgi:hypothetical protein